jgi:hypothetical protein
VYQILQGHGIVNFGEEAGDLLVGFQKILLFESG